MSPRKHGGEDAPTREPAASAKRPGVTRRERARLRREESREALIVAAVRRFSTWGFADTSVEEIAREAGVSHTTFYKHFDSKDEIFAEIEAEANRVLIERVGAAFEAHRADGTAELVRALADAMLGTLEEHIDVARAIVPGPRSLVRLAPGKDVAAPPVREAVIAWLIEHARSGGAALDRGDADAVASGLAGLWLRMAFNYLTRIGDAPNPALRRHASDLLARATLGLLRGAIEAPAPPRRR